jgi:hypothetical protein
LHNKDKRQQSQLGKKDEDEDGAADEGIVNSCSIQDIPLTFTDLLSK